MRPKKSRNLLEGWQKVADPNSDRRSVMASPNVGNFKGTPVYLWVADKSQPAKMVDADLHDDLAKGSNKAELFELEVCCPRCNEWNRIPGDKKPIDVRYLDKPIRLTHPHDGSQIVQSAVITINETMQCSHPVGKTICGYTFRIRENKIVKA